ncbi:MAG TPA: pirin family protein [Xanthobacteraceae bacterium]|nr:pirin family protein [Xanthobacteraceae bacterium]
MSFFPAEDPKLGDPQSCDALDLVIVPRTADLGDFTVRRALPSSRRRMVGPFTFLDHMGPTEFKAGHGVDVRPHPHIGLATVTYLFKGEIVHKDSLGSDVPIRPGDVNWMTAGRGITHSERTAPDHRQGGEPLHGLQCWVALPVRDEETDPLFAHYGQQDLPLVTGEGKSARIVAGKMFGVSSPVKTLHDTFFADLSLEAGTSVPLDADYEERAIYVVSGEIEIAGERFGEGKLLVFKPGDRITMRASQPARFAMLGGAPMDGPRYIWWNFVSSRKERIEDAKADWKAGRFEGVPGDTEFIPLPER